VVFFFCGKPTGCDCLAQGVGQNSGLPAHHRRRMSLHQQRPGIFQFGGIELGALSPRLGHKESRRAPLPIKLGRTLDRHQRYPEGLGHVTLRRAALHDQLAGEQPETRQITLGMGEDRKMAVVVDDLITFAPAGQISIDFHAARRKDRKLHLWHGRFLSPMRLRRQSENPSFLVSFSFRPHRSGYA
jgi:hypothetical protein